MKKLMIIMLMIFVASSFVEGAVYEVYTIPKCYGPSQMIVNADVQEQFNMIDWAKIDDTRWEYHGCDGSNHTIYLETAGNKTKNIFNFRVEYYIAPYLEGDNDSLTLTANEIENEGNKRIENINGFKVGPKPVPFKWDIPEGSELMIYIIVFGAIILIVIVAVIVGFKKLTSDKPAKTDVFGYKEVSNNAPAVNNAPVADEPTDEEVEKFLREMRGK